MNKALLVGINKYPTSPLKGCVNDCLLMYKLLSEKFNFNPKNINVITDAEATKNNIINGLHELVKDSVPGDIIYFHYSGHGSQVVVKDWTNNEEADGFDETLCTVDLNWENPLRDNDLNYIFSSLHNDVKCLVVLDSCHSGTGLREFGPNPTPITPRFIDPPLSNMLFNPKVSINDNLNLVLPEYDEKDIQTIKNKFLVNTTKQKNIILISGCQDNQTSADAFINGRYHGALTYYLHQTLVNAACDITYQDLITTVNKHMDVNQFSQNPQLECNSNLFAAKFLK